VHIENSNEVVIIQAIFVYKSLLDDSLKEVPINIESKADIDRVIRDLQDNDERYKTVTMIIGDNKVVPVPIMVWDWKDDTAMLYKIVAVKYKV
jgi:hypothetical protein